MEASSLRKGRSLSTSDLEAARVARRVVSNQPRPRRKSLAQRPPKQFMSDEELFASAPAYPDMHYIDIPDINTRSASAFFTVFGNIPMDGMPLQPPLDHVPAPYDNEGDYFALPPINPNAIDQSGFPSFQPCWPVHDLQRPCAFNPCPDADYFAHQSSAAPIFTDGSVDEAMMYFQGYPQDAGECYDGGNYGNPMVAPQPEIDAEWMGECDGWIQL
jgi:hypothetical protein